MNRMSRIEWNVPLYMRKYENISFDLSFQASIPEAALWDG